MCQQYSTEYATRNMQFDVPIPFGYNLIISVPPSSSGPGHQPFKLETGIRIPLGAYFSRRTLPVGGVFIIHGQ